MKLRSDYKDAFVEKHGVKLGLMSGFVKVCSCRFFHIYTYLSSSNVVKNAVYAL